MNQIAAYYNVPGLVELANSNIKQCLDADFSVTAFCHVAENLSSSSTDENWQSILAKIVPHHVAELSGSRVLQQLQDMRGLAFECLTVCISRLEDLEASFLALTVSAANTREEMVKYRETSEGMKECHDRLRSTSGCSNCGTEFGCEITPRIRSSDHLYIVRCADCRCKH